MRFKEFTPQLLSEIAMNPNSLRSLVSKIQATAGLEFEMYVPNAAELDGYAESEPDYSRDERARSIDDIVSFFGEGNTSRITSRLRNDLESEYQDWVMGEEEEEWRDVALDYIIDYLKKNDYEDEIEKAFSNLGFTATEKDAAKDARDALRYKKESPDPEGEALWSKALEGVEELITERAHEIIELEGREYDEIRDDWASDNFDTPEEDEFLKQKGIMHMSDVENEYTYLSWPHLTEPEGPEFDIDSIGDWFSGAIGRKVNVSKRYHGAPRNPGEYALEPDGSLGSPDDEGDGGLEFISPPLPFSEMMTDLEKVRAWANSMGCYTNESTGLHMNISVPEMADAVDFDYVKLALLLGDQHVLSKFGRDGNTYCKSSMNIIKSRARSLSPDEITSMLDQMRGGLGECASNAIHDGSTTKFVSINKKEGYIEFRSPGGDWLGDNYDEIKSTMMRFVVAVDAACHPEKYRQEYLKKLYKLLNVQTEQDPIAYFARYSSGQLPLVALRSFIRQLQMVRASKNRVTNVGTPHGTDERGVANTSTSNDGPHWEVYSNVDSEWFTTQARTPRDARNNMRQEMPNSFPASVSDENIPVRPHV